MVSLLDIMLISSSSSSDSSSVSSFPSSCAIKVLSVELWWRSWTSLIYPSWRSNSYCNNSASFMSWSLFLSRDCEWGNMVFSSSFSVSSLSMTTTFGVTCRIFCCTRSVKTSMAIWTAAKVVVRYSGWYQNCRGSGGWLRLLLLLLLLLCCCT